MIKIKAWIIVFIKFIFGQNGFSEQNFPLTQARMEPS